MASGSSGAGRGRGRGAGGGGAAGHLGAAIAPRECESCRAAPGIPFCRVEWSFLCTGCAAVVHGHSWIVAVPPSSTPAPNTVAAGSYSMPYGYQYPLHANPSAGPNPNPPPPAASAAAAAPPSSSQVNPSPSPVANPVHVVQLSSDEDESAGDPGEDDESSGGRKRRRPSSEGDGAGREASVMRYKEKRKSRNFDKTIRYESRKVHAEMKPRVGGKFVKTADDAADEVEGGDGGEGEDGAGRGDFDSGGHVIRAGSGEDAGANAVAQSDLPGVQLKPLDPGEMVTTSPSFEVEQFGGVDLGQMDGGEEVGLL